jgi:hypothetical protein
MRSMDPFGKFAGEQHFAFCKVRKGRRHECNSEITLR